MKQRKAYNCNGSTLKRAAPKGGFTLLELLFAVVILAAAMLPMYGLQSTALDRVLRSENELQATLIARQILSFIEGSEDKLRSTNARLTALETLRTVASGAKGVTYQPTNEELLNQYYVSFVIEPWTIELLGNTALFRLLLEVSWSDNPRDRLQFTYLFPAPPPP
jgi:prepilin-type N-terminal cleavage/methylation domain-containing protein